MGRWVGRKFENEPVIGGAVIPTYIVEGEGKGDIGKSVWDSLMVGVNGSRQKGDCQRTMPRSSDGE